MMFQSWFWWRELYDPTRRDIHADGENGLLDFWRENFFFFVIER